MTQERAMKKKRKEIETVLLPKFLADHQLNLHDPRQSDEEEQRIQKF